jgi:glycosyltransferase involved in cell wall biosynthesis
MPQTRDSRSEDAPTRERRAGVAGALRPENAQFVVLSFEGPDRYSAAGGLGVRVRDLCQALAADGFTVHLFFVGEPELPGVERDQGVMLHRWAQEISRGAAEGVYDEEERKVEDMCVWLPHQLCDLVVSGVESGRATVVLAEDWHTAYPLLALHDVLVEKDLRHRAVLGWNANNRFGFWRIDWGRLTEAAALFTVSRHMKQILWGQGVNPTVVPNGIAGEWLDMTSSTDVAEVRRSCDADLLLAKIGRWHPDKRWHMAVETTARLKEKGHSVLLVARGWKGSEEAGAHLADVRSHASARGLRWTEWSRPVDTRDALVELLTDQCTQTDVLELGVTVPDAQLGELYGAADAVLANSGFEPFGLVGLEVMACGGIAVTGGTGEDYVLSFHNGFALETDRPSEVVAFLEWLDRNPARKEAMGRAARETARLYHWENVIDRLLFALQLEAQEQGVSLPTESTADR